MNSTPEVAPNHSEARSLKVRFRHVHRNQWTVSQRLSKDPFFVERSELAGTIVSRDVGAGRVEVSLVLVHPNDAHPPKPTREQRQIQHLRAALELLCLSNVPNVTALARFSLNAVPEPCPKVPSATISRKAGRQRAWDRLADGRSLVMNLEEFKDRLKAGTLVPLLADFLKLPPESAAGVE